MNDSKPVVRYQQTMLFIGVALLFLGIGRMFSLVMHEPVLGYANNYDMIRLQACHQIWPADAAVNIRTGTPQAPLRRYTLDKRVDTPCHPSAELLFTSTAIALATWKNYFTGETLISIKSIGMVKAVCLAITAVLVSFYFYRRALYSALLINGLIMLAVLSDPGVTLYMNTFYTEFSAIYFVYLALAGAAIVVIEQWRPIGAMPLLVGLLGIGFSMPQHLPLTLGIGLSVAAYAIAQRQWQIAPIIAVFLAMPLLLQTSATFTPRSEAMTQTSRINLLGSLLEHSDHPDQLLAHLTLPKSCQSLRGKNGYDPNAAVVSTCPELQQLNTTTILLALLRQPALFFNVVKQALLEQKNWVFDLYGQVENGKTESASHYQRTLNNLIRPLPDVALLWIVAFSIAAPLLLLTAGKIRTGKIHALYLYLGLLLFMQWIVLVSAITGNGLVGIGKNIHLYTPLLLAEIAILPIAFSVWRKTGDHS
ncbi:MAG TPA: hypothetical protein PK031_10120 [Pseudomonadales bacterium]|nr:hypothetical protein [Pseudomonadales bacterium]